MRGNKRARIIFDAAPDYVVPATVGFVASEARAAPEAVEFQAVAGDGGHTNGFDQPQPAHQSGDAEGARLIALNMALNGTPREETARYLSENFHLADAGGLLDEVYASVES